MNSKFAILPLSIILVTLVGCSGGSGPKTTQASVSGTVTFDGKAISRDSNVLFISDQEGGRASGVIDSLGGYTLKAALPTVGIPVGRYTVSVTPPAQKGAASSALSPSDSANYMKAMSQPASRKKAAVAPESEDTIKEIPKAFRLTETSTIVIELKAGENKIDFDLAKISTK